MTASADAIGWARRTGGSRLWTWSATSLPRWNQRSWFWEEEMSGN